MTDDPYACGKPTPDGPCVLHRGHRIECKAIVAAARNTRRGASYATAPVRSLRLTESEWADLEVLAEVLPARGLRSDPRHDNGRNREAASKSETVAHVVRLALELADERGLKAIE